MKARYIRPGDEDAVVALARLDVEETLPHLLPIFSEHVTRETFRRAVATGSPTIFVCEADNGDLIGFILVQVWPYLFAEGVHTSQEVVFVRPEKRGTRAAALLYDLYSRWAEGTGAAEAYGGISNGMHPERTARFIKRYGFQEVGIILRRVQVGADAVASDS